MNLRESFGHPHIPICTGFSVKHIDYWNRVLRDLATKPKAPDCQATKKPGAGHEAP